MPVACLVSGFRQSHRLLNRWDIRTAAGRRWPARAGLQRGCCGLILLSSTSSILPGLHGASAQLWPVSRPATIEPQKCRGARHPPGCADPHSFLAGSPQARGCAADSTEIMCLQCQQGVRGLFAEPCRIVTSSKLRKRAAAARREGLALFSATAQPSFVAQAALR